MTTTVPEASAAIPAALPPATLATPIVRVWRFRGVTLQDPLPGQPLETVRRVHALQYSAITNAKIDGPAYEGHQEVYTYTPHGGTFG